MDEFKQLLNLIKETTEKMLEMKIQEDKRTQDFYSVIDLINKRIDKLEQISKLDREANHKVFKELAKIIDSTPEVESIVEISGIGAKKLAKEYFKLREANK